jgi:hypothetical protein
MTHRCTEATKRKRRYLEMARRIAEGEANFISSARGVSALTHKDCNALTDLAGEGFYFDDDGLTPTTETRHERVMFLCFAAAR